MTTLRWTGIAFAAGVLLAPALAAAAEPATLESLKAALEKSQGDAKVNMDTLWTMVAAFLVFFMNAGFAFVESGLCRAKNAANILSKNFVVFAIATLSFFALGFGLMFGDGNAFLGTNGLFALSGADNSPATGDAYQGAYSAMKGAGIPLYAKFFFQLVFAGTAATIVSGAVAERIKLHAFLIFSVVMGAVIYPIAGHWIWGGGFLATGDRQMFDFAGSTVVHSVGGWAALAGILVLGPRMGKFTKGGKVKPIPGHSMALATLGVFILWLGWFGFNPGSTLEANGASIAHIALTTNLAAAAATMVATLVAWLKLGKPDLSMTLNGCLAGLVAITAGCAYVSPLSALAIGAGAGGIVVLAVLGFDRLRIDDPVGALSVHLVNGIFGTLCVGLFAEASINKDVGDGLLFGGGAGLLVRQLQGVLMIGAFTFASSFAAWYAIKKLVGIRVSAEEEFHGLDVGEMGMEAYPGDPLGHADYGLEPPPAPARAPAPAAMRAEAATGDAE
jgi:Amt family ammonium transporter